MPIPDDNHACSYVELFQGRLRDYIHESLTRGTKYLPMIQEVFRAEGLPLDLAYIPVIESGFKTNALSKASARARGSSCGRRRPNRGSRPTGMSTSGPIRRRPPLPPRAI